MGVTNYGGCEGFAGRQLIKSYLKQHLKNEEFNSRKGRNGAFWQGRSHATAVATDDHIIRCMASR